jgi:hypothetical protein
MSDQVGRKESIQSCVTDVFVRRLSTVFNVNGGATKMRHEDLPGFNHHHPSNATYNIII